MTLRWPQDSQESLDSPVATAAIKSALDQRILAGAFDDLAAKAAETATAAAAAAPSTGASSDASAAEAALLEAWRSRQLSSDRAADEVELGPMIGRGGFGQVSLILPIARSHVHCLMYKCIAPGLHIPQGTAQPPGAMLQVHKARWRGALVSCPLITAFTSTTSCCIYSIQGTRSCNPCAHGSELGTKVSCFPQ
jgi:hypothetical protein